ncbi:MAG TPA: 3-deoxy-7-phosphoheptulonate synthase [Planctomycetota bacterium]|nr:3-deoxy-7-phosphoheptulonate synthase [Planctomycetota bacterium]
MIFIMKPGASDTEIQHVVERIEKKGLSPHVSKGTERTIIGARGDEQKLAELPLAAIPGVERVIPVLKPYRLASREVAPSGTAVSVGGVKIGAGHFMMCAGPCTVESLPVLAETARLVRAAGAQALRGGAFKPRTSPYAFQGLGEDGLKFLREVGDAEGLPVVTEVRDLRHVELVARYADCLQVGARNMQNFDLLLELGRVRKPVLLKRGLSATIKELLMSAEYILAEGNHEVILCERGIRTFETATRGTLDISAVAVLKAESHLPVMVDPSHAAGRADLVESLTLAAVAAGADGIIVEVHPCPEEAVCDGEQALLPAKFTEMMKKVKAIRKVVA